MKINKNGKKIIKLLLGTIVSIIGYTAVIYYYDWHLGVAIFIVQFGGNLLNSIFKDE